MKSYFFRITKTNYYVCARLCLFVCLTVCVHVCLHACVCWCGCVIFLWDWVIMNYFRFIDEFLEMTPPSPPHPRSYRVPVPIFSTSGAF